MPNRNQITELEKLRNEKVSLDEFFSKSQYEILFLENMINSLKEIRHTSGIDSEIKVKEGELAELKFARNEIQKNKRILSESIIKTKIDLIANHEPC